MLQPATITDVPFPYLCYPVPVDTLKRKDLLALALVLLAVVFAYANSFGNAFEFDDFHTVIDNPAVRSLSNVPRFFTDTTTFSVEPANRTYRPVVSAMLAFDYALGHGYAPFWFHLSTFLLFLLLIALLSNLYLLLLDHTRTGPPNRWLALFAAAWFGLHPAMAETVNYVIQRGDLYCTLGCVCALWLFARYPHRRRSGLYLLPFALAMLSKPPAAVFPVLLGMYTYFFEDLDIQALRRLRRASIAAVPALVAAALLLALQAAMTPRSYAPSLLSAADYRLTQPFVWMHYVGELFLPLHLNIDSDLAAFSTLNAQAVVGILFLLALLVAIFFTARRRSLYPIAFGLLWFIITQLPTSLYALSEVENDHRMFFSFVGLILAVVWAAWLVWLRVFSAEARAHLRTAAVSLVLLALAGYAYGVHVRNAVWHTPESLWYDDIGKSPHNGRGLMNYALTQMSKGNYPQALLYFTQAQQYTPNYPTLEINLGIVDAAMGLQGDPVHANEAEAHFLRAVELAPGSDLTHAYYGQWLDQQGRTAEALEQLQQAAALDPQRPLQRDALIVAEEHKGDALAAHGLALQALAADPTDAPALQVLHDSPAQVAAYWVNTSLTLNREGLFSQSITAARRALDFDPLSASAYNNIAADEAAMQHWDAAIVAVQQALRLQPDLQIAQNNLALYKQKLTGSPSPDLKSPAEWLNASLASYQVGHYAECIAESRQALSLQPDYAEAWNNIAAAEAAQKHWPAAIGAAQKAIALKPDFQLAKNNLAWALQEQAKAK